MPGRSARISIGKYGVPERFTIGVNESFICKREDFFNIRLLSMNDLDARLEVGCLPIQLSEEQKSSPKLQQELSSSEITGFTAQLETLIASFRAAQDEKGQITSEIEQLNQQISHLREKIRVDSRLSLILNMTSIMSNFAFYMEPLVQNTQATIFTITSTIVKSLK